MSLGDQVQIPAPLSAGSLGQPQVLGGLSGPPNTKSGTLLDVKNLVPEGPNGLFTTQQVQELLRVVESSQQYGREIEQSVVQLADLLKTRTLECDGLRTLATDTYEPLRRAVRQEYDMRLKAESRHALEHRKVTMANETLRNENYELRTEVAALRRRVEELEQVPKGVEFNRESQSVFARMMRDGAPEQLAADSPLALFKVMQSEATTPQQRDFLQYIATMGVPHARAFQERRWFDLLKIAVRRLCTTEKLPNNSSDSDLLQSPNLRYPEIEATLASVVRDARTNNASAIALEAQQPITLVSRSIKEKISDLYLANNPRKVGELEKLFQRYAGREEELYQTLRREYASPNFEEIDESDPGLGMNRRAGSIISMSSLQAAGGGSGGGLGTPVTRAKLSPTELKEMHARCVIMYKKYNPAKANSRDFNEMLKKYQPDVLLNALVEKYGPEPTAQERKEIIKRLVEEESSP